MGEFDVLSQRARTVVSVLRRLINDVNDWRLYFSQRCETRLIELCQRRESQRENCVRNQSKECHILREKKRD